MLLDITPAALEHLVKNCKGLPEGMAGFNFLLQQISWQKPNIYKM
jgi:hypothetical protein